MTELKGGSTSTMSALRNRRRDDLHRRHAERMLSDQESHEVVGGTVRLQSGWLFQMHRRLWQEAHLSACSCSTLPNGVGGSSG